MKTNTLLGFVLALILMVSAAPLVAAGNVSIYAYWVGANSQTLTVTQGDIPQIMITGDSLAPAMKISVELLKNGQYVNTLLQVDNLTQDSYTKQLSLNTASLLGVYTVKATIASYNSEDTEVLTLTVSPKVKTPPPPQPQNHAPILNPIGNKTVEVGKVLEFTVTASDADNDPLTFSAAPLPAGTTFNTVSGKYKYSPQFTGDHPITFTVSDGKAEDAETIVITVVDKGVPTPVEPKNTAPVLNSIPSLHVNEGDSISYTISAVDPDKNQKLTYYVDIVSNGGNSYDALVPLNVPQGATFNSNSGVFTFAPSYEFITHPQKQKLVTLKFKAYDGKAFSAWKFVTITVNDVNRKPLFVTNEDQITVYVGETISLDLYATDADTEDILSYGMENAPAAAQLTSTHFSWKTTSSDIGSRIMAFSVTDGMAVDKYDVQLTVKEKPVAKTQCSDGVDNDGDHLIDMNDPGCTSPHDNDETNVVVSPPPQNTPPVIGSIPTISGKEGQLIQFSFAVFDKDGDKLTVTPYYSADQKLLPLISINGSGVNVIKNNDNTFTVQLKPLYSFVKHPQTTRSFTLLLELNDGTLSTSRLVNVIVEDVNQLPQFQPIGDKIVYVDENLTFSVTADDADSEDSQNYAVQDLPVGAKFTKDGFSWNPTASQVGTYTVTFTVSDGFVIVSEPVTITVLVKNNGGNNPPPPPPPPPAKAQCSDGIDNDGDGLVDMTDPGCSSPQDNDEKNTTPTPVPPAVVPPLKVEAVDFNITSVKIAPEVVIMSQYNTTQVLITVDNESAVDAKDVRGIVMIPDLGLIQSTRLFDLNGDKDKTVGLALDIPYGTPAGTYLVQIMVGNEVLHSTAYRQLTIIK